ncbi:sporulation integral membrane protein YtvI [Bacillus cereus]|uniref:AI-2E family transporter n=1 Tax=Bacillus thuringiensis TaxID=1428 RepID=A0A9X6WFR6_BACTU|nr:AI-2E family transporter [Bacillus thuringiensis]PFJ24629.1 AI-2E family transporter [Bacillus thuringiensis]
MLLFYKKWARTIMEIGLLLLTIYCLSFLLTGVFKIAAPIFIALLIYGMVSPLLNFLRKKGMKLSLATPVAMLVFISLIFVVVITVGTILSSQIEQLAILVPKCVDYLKHFTLGRMDFFHTKINSIPPDIMGKLQEAGQLLATKTSALVSSLLKGLVGGIGSAFSSTANCLIGVILAYLLCLEIDDWKTFIQTKTPNSLRETLKFLKTNVFAGIGKYAKAQLKLIGFSFSIIFVGLVIAKVPNAFSISVLSAILDILPLLGIPVIFVPWAIYCFIVGKTGFGIFLLCLLGFTMLFRQIMEPKIAGDSLGVSAFVMLSIMIISLSFFGVAGIIASPIITILLKSVYEQGYLARWIHIPKDEFEQEKPPK